MFIYKNLTTACNSGYIGDNDLSIHESFHTITTTDLVSWSFQVAKGMEYLAKCGFLHCDVAARNVLLCNNRTVKICDFRLSQWTQSDEKYDDELSVGDTVVVDIATCIGFDKLFRSRVLCQ